jgi:Grx4 family monothiol glutaredoxin
MKGSKLFPQCGFSNTATQILTSYGIDFHTVDVLSDENIRQGIKEFSNWPTIPQLYVAGEFVSEHFEFCMLKFFTLRAQLKHILSLFLCPDWWKRHYD